MKEMLVLVFGLAVAQAALEGSFPDSRWVNNFGEPLYFTCPSHQSIVAVKSVYDSQWRDRLWDFRCGGTFDYVLSCEWTQYVHNAADSFEFKCPTGMVISGMANDLDNWDGGRRWKFYCCQGEVAVIRNCAWSTHVNNFKDNLSWNAPPKHYMAGVGSYFNNTNNPSNDRRWRYYSCEKY